MSFTWPLALLALLAVPLVGLAYLLIQRRRMRYAIAFTNLEVLASVVEPRRAWRRWVPAALFLLALAATGVALARPQVTISVPQEDATVMLVVDTSGSMFAEDVRPTRLGAAQQALRRFLERVPEQFRVGLLAFSEQPQLVTPPTRDHALVRDGVEFLYPQFGTAIGDALLNAAQATRGAAAAGAAARDEDQPPATILFLSDGAQTEGILEPLEGARRARQLGVRVYTIALGTPNGVVELSFGGLPRVIPVPPDPFTLRRVAQVTGGRFFEAPTAEALTAAYDELGSQVSRTREPREATSVFLAAAALLTVAAGGLSLLWSARIP